VRKRKSLRRKTRPLIRGWEKNEGKRGWGAIAVNDRVGREDGVWTGDPGDVNSEPNQIREIVAMPGTPRFPATDEQRTKGGELQGGTAYVEGKPETALR